MSTIKSKPCCLYVIEKANVWSPHRDPIVLDLLIKDGRLLQMKSRIDFDGTRIDAKGCVLLPCGVDAQTHLRVPGQSQKETPETGLLAALRGGYSAILTMPNTMPTIDSPLILKQGQEAVRPFEEKYGVSVFWSAAITKNLDSSDLTNLEDLVKAGAIAFTNDGLGVNDDHVMAQAFSKLELLGVPLLQHAEFLGHGGTLAPGPIQQNVQARPYPEEPEWKMVERDIRELRKYPKARYHVLHISSARTLGCIRAAKKDGLNVTAEVSPHHLYFNNETITSDNLSFKMNPPIRSKEDQKALWEALIDGTIDFVSTDHAPHEENKKVGSVETAAFGTLGLETTLKVLIAGWMARKITPQRLVQVFAKNPAKFLKLEKGFGELKLGTFFHAVLIDVNAGSNVFSAEDISSLSKNSCFIGQKLPGKIVGAFHKEHFFEFE